MEREIDGLLHVIADVFRLENRDRVLGDRLDDGDDVHFLHAELAHAQRLAVLVEHAVGPLHLAGDEERRSRIEPCAGDAGDSIGASRPGGHHAHAEMIGGFGVGFRAHGAGLFVRIADRHQSQSLRRAIDSGAWRRRR